MSDFLIWITFAPINFVCHFIYCWFARDDQEPPKITGMSFVLYLITGPIGSVLWGFLGVIVGMALFIGYVSESLRSITLISFKRNKNEPER